MATHAKVTNGQQATGQSAQPTMQIEAENTARSSSPTRRTTS